MRTAIRLANNTSIVMFTNNANTYSGTITVTGVANNNSYLGVNGNTALQFATINVVGVNTGTALWGRQPRPLRNQRNRIGQQQ